MVDPLLARFPATPPDETPLVAGGGRQITPARLEEAVTALREAQRKYTRERQPTEWAMLQNNLGNALRRLGERDPGPARLEEAIAAYRGALEIYTRVRAPLEWAMTQNNLGAALRALGLREAGTARLEEAVAAYREALTEYRPERVPLDWAMTHCTIWAPRCGRWASARPARHGWRRRSPPTARRCGYAPGNARRSTGR